MTGRSGCFMRLIYFGLLLVVFGGSSYLWFTIFVRGKSVETPNLIGRDLARARGVSADRGIEILVDNSRDRNHDKVAVGAVVWQNREPGALIKRGTRIYVGQSLGPLILQVPNLQGQSARTALLRFSQRNLKLGAVSYAAVPNVNGIIITDPPEGTVVPAETAVSLLLAYPPAPSALIMPDLIDRNLAEVRPVLEGQGLQVSNVKFEPYPGIADGVIIRQFPLQGSPVTRRDSISLVVTKVDAVLSEEPQVAIPSQGPMQIPVPLPGQAPTQPPAQPPIQ